MTRRRDGALRTLAALVLGTVLILDARVASADEAAPQAGPTPREATYDDVAPPSQPATAPSLQRTSWMCQETPPGCPCPEVCLPNPALTIPCIDDCVAEYRDFRKKSCLGIQVGGYHWWNYDPDEDEVTYGFPGSEGTYFYFVKLDFKCKTGSACYPEWGIHLEARFRDKTKFRSYFDGFVWVQEAYVWLDIAQKGRVKAGVIWKRFGIDWRGGFWGNSQYWDGWKTDSDWGLSWEQVWNKGRRFEMPTFVQVFFIENEVNGSLPGGDPESTPLYKEALTGVVRALPTWHFDKNTSLAVGVSGILGSIPAKAVAPTGDQTLSGYALDFTFKWCDFSIYGEWGETFGTQNQSHYVTGGPSDRYTHASIGAQYQYGPFTFRLQYSHADYSNPGGSQDVYVAGIDTQLTSWLKFTAEYVDWPLHAALLPDRTLERGWQFVFKWWF